MVQMYIRSTRTSSFTIRNKVTTKVQRVSKHHTRSDVVYASFGDFYKNVKHCSYVQQYH